MATTHFTKQNLYGYAALLLMIACTVWIFYPSNNLSRRYWSKTTWHVKQSDMVPYEKANAQAEAILAELHRLDRSDKLTVEKVVDLQRQLFWLDKHAEYRGPNPRPDAQMFDRVYTALGYFTAARGDFLRRRDRKSSRLNGKDFREVLEADSTYMAVEKFIPSTTESNAWQMAGLYFLWYLMTLPVGLLICTLVHMHVNLTSFWQALVLSSDRRMQVLFYPFGAIRILLGLEGHTDYNQAMRRLIRGLSYATAASISVFGGAAQAQTVKKSDNKKSEKSHSIQVDIRNSSFLGDGPPDPNIFNRASFYERKWLLETITTTTPETGAWYNEIGGGVFLKRTSRTWFTLVGYTSQNNLDARQVMVGMQFFRFYRWGVIAIPVMRFEQSITDPSRRFVAFAANPLFKLSPTGPMSRFAVSPDILFRKPVGPPVVWNVGGGFDVFLGKAKKHRAEVAVLKNSKGQIQVRSRVVMNFSFN